MGGNPEHVLWLYAAERSDVWYDAGKSLARRPRCPRPRVGPSNPGLRRGAAATRSRSAVARRVPSDPARVPRAAADRPRTAPGRRSIRLATTAPPRPATTTAPPRPATTAQVVSDTLDLYRFLGSKIPPGPMNQPYKVQQLRLAKQTLKKQGYDSIVLTDHVDGCERCWARDRRTVEIVSLGAFRPKCPCSSRFQRTAPGADWRRHAIRAHGVPMIPKGGERYRDRCGNRVGRGDAAAATWIFRAPRRGYSATWREVPRRGGGSRGSSIETGGGRYSAAESAVLRGCDCANATASPWGRAVIC